MKRLLSSSLLVGLLMVACSRVPISNRSRVLLVDDAAMNQQALVSYKSFLDTSRVVTGSSQGEMVRRVGRRLADAATQYFREHNQSDVLKGFNWEFNLVQDPQVNAWCMPGGKVVVYTGILPVTQTEAGLATVMGHEISHAIARHGSERVSQQYVAQLGLAGSSLVLGEAVRSKSPQSQALWNNIFGLAAPAATQVAILKYSRDHEYEADHLGTIFMAMAGYDPREAAQFWTRMGKASAGKARPPQFLSTHPADANRVARINKILPEAQKYYQRSQGRGASSVGN